MSQSRPWVLGLIALLLAGGGCARPVSLAAWQKEIEQYVWREANGDPAVLAQQTFAADRKGFAILGQANPAQSTDANAILLAHRSVAGRPRFFYLVGLVRKRQVQDIRLAAMTFDGQRFEWQWSKQDSAAVQRYRNYKQQHWQRYYPDRQTPPPLIEGFPGVEDAFSLFVQGRHVVATHGDSEAQWVLTLEPSNGDK